MKKTLSKGLLQFEDDFNAEEALDPHTKYMRIKEATAMYKISRPTLDKIASKIGAKYKVGGVALIDANLMEEYMSKCRIPGSEEHKYG